LDQVFDFAIYAMQVCLILHTYLKFHKLKALEVESSEELSKVCFGNSLKNPKLLQGVEVT
jgi:hypothetical protein